MCKDEDDFNFMKSGKLFSSKKGLGPVVTTSLLLVIAIVAIVSFSTWVSNYSSNIFSNVETKSDDALDGSLYVDQLIGSTLYVYNNIQDNLSITELKIGGNICPVMNNLNLGMNEVSVKKCVSDLTTVTPEIVLITKKNVVAKKVYFDDIVTRLNCSGLNGGEWVLVEGDMLYGTSDFCVMKYEAKWNGSGTINNPVSGYCGNGNDYNSSTGCIDDTEGVTSQAASKPLSQVNQFEAKVLCERLGPNYHLITNNEWMTIVRFAESDPTNWVDGNIGSNMSSGGGLYRGNVWDFGGCGTATILDGNTPGTNCVINGRNKRTLNISGELLWDLSGNVYEWVDEVVDCSGGYSDPIGTGVGCLNLPYNSTDVDSNWHQLTEINYYGSLSYNLLRPSNLQWDINQGVGEIYTRQGNSNPSSSLWNTSHALLRGGQYDSNGYGGVYSVTLSMGPSMESPSYGFRCTYTP